MSRTTIGTAISTALLRRLAASLAVIALLLSQQTGQVRAQVPSDGPLTFFKNYPVTGDFAVGGIGLRGQGVVDPIDPTKPTQKLATGNIPMTGVPADADILAAFLYWQSMETPDPLTPSQLLADHGYFRGYPIVGKSLGADDVKSCWGSGGGGGNGNSITVLRTYRASVLQYLPYQTVSSTSPVPIGKRLVNSSDLTAAGLPPHQVKLPDTGGGGSQSPQSGNQANLLEGASLVVVYRVPTMPLRMVTIYDGAYTADQAHGGLFSQTIRGIDDALPSGADAKVTFLVGDGDPNFEETMTIRGGTAPVSPASPLTLSNPFVGALGFSWDTPTPYSISDATFTTASSTSIYKDRLVANVTPNGPSIDCLSFSGAIASAKVEDKDFDGLLDRWEDIGLEDVGTGQVLNLPAMGANKNVQDIFVQVDYMKSTSGYTTPLNPTSNPVLAHSHVLTEDVINNIASVFQNAGVRRNPADSSQTKSGAINIHIDIGNLYSTNANVIHSPYARGGNIIEETQACEVGGTCQFPGFEGVVGWKIGFRAIRDGSRDSSTSTAACEEPACHRRFDEIRHKAFRYALLAHAIGVPQVDDPSTTTIDESKYPRTIAGVGDGGNGGGDFMNTLGFWENNTGTKYMQAAVFVHELGHTLALRHGGSANTEDNPSPNCKPNYESVMNYMYLVRGLTLSNGQAFVDYSKQVVEDQHENTLTELSALKGVDLSPLLYPNRWYAPLSSSWLDTHIGTTAATKHCDGTPLTSADTTPMVRIDGVYPLTDPNDWNGDGDTLDSGISQDVNFNGKTNDAVKDGTFAGYDDFLNMDLRQGATRRMSRGLSLEVETTDTSQADPAWADPAWADPAWADPAWADPAWADPAWADPAWADPAWADSYAAEFDKKQAESLGNAPNFLSWTANTALKSIDLKWYPPNVGTPTRWLIWRAVGKITKTNKPTNIADLPVNSPSFTYGSDGSVLYHDTSSKNNTDYSYFVTAKIGSQATGKSNTVFPARR